jgi:hypothetical protein
MALARGHFLWPSVGTEHTGVGQRTLQVPDVTHGRKQADID